MTPLTFGSRTLVSNGAHSFAASALLELVDPLEMMSNFARDNWRRSINRVSNSDAETINSSGMNMMQDTVGAVAWDAEGGFASGVSR